MQGIFPSVCIRQVPGRRLEREGLRERKKEENAREQEGSGILMRYGAQLSSDSEEDKFENFRYNNFGQKKPCPAHKILLPFNPTTTFNARMARKAPHLDPTVSA
jgi:hypothetical protein